MKPFSISLHYKTFAKTDQKFYIWAQSYNVIKQDRLSMIVNFFTSNGNWSGSNIL